MKIDTIMSDLRDNTTINTQDEITEHTPLTNLTLMKFQTVTIEHVEKLLSNAANKMCQLDPIPTNIVKAISGSISPLLRDIINTSLTQQHSHQISKKQYSNHSSRRQINH